MSWHFLTQDKPICSHNQINWARLRVNNRKRLQAGGRPPLASNYWNLESEKIQVGPTICRTQYKTFGFQFVTPHMCHSDESKYNSRSLINGWHGKDWLGLGFSCGVVFFLYVFIQFNSSILLLRTHCPACFHPTLTHLGEWMARQQTCKELNEEVL